MVKNMMRIPVKMMEKVNAVLPTLMIISKL